MVLRSGKIGGKRLGKSARNEDLMEKKEDVAALKKQKAEKIRTGIHRRTVVEWLERPAIIN